ncbi:MAG: cardiolipin synthase [Clostridia bacterium]|nr:cardiolipin synthase [Clostridia bacterium]
MYKTQKDNRVKSVRVKPQGLGAVVWFLTSFALAFQAAVLVFLYAFLAWIFPAFFYASLILTFITCIFVFSSDRDAQSKAGWLILMIASCGCGYIIFILANKKVCYGAYKRTFDRLYSRTAKFSPAASLESCSEKTRGLCTYLKNAAGFAPYTDTDIKYLNSPIAFFEDFFKRVESAEKFIFIEFFIVADGALFERLLSALSKKVNEGVDVRLLYDDAGSLGLFSRSAKKRVQKAGILLQPFSKMLALFSFGLNLRDHRKIIVIDGKTAYAGGCNVVDECIESRALWKDAGVRLDGAGVEAMTLAFLRQWQFESGKYEDFEKFLNLHEKTENDSTVMPYAGGPDLKEDVCHGVYLNMINSAKNRLYIMTPYFAPGSAVLSAIKAKALSGVDVRLVLPEVPDWLFLYRVTVSYAESLIPYGVKVYFAKNTFVHSKVVLIDGCASVGSVNMDMRSFYLEFDNGVISDDKKFLLDAEKDFEAVFAENKPAQKRKENIFGRAVTGFLKIFSPLM